MKIINIEFNNRKKVFEVTTKNNQLSFPYGNLEYIPSNENPLAKVWIDLELGKEAFSYLLKDGQEGTVHIDHILEYNRDPNYMTELLLYKMTIEAKRHLETTSLSNREIIRQLKTSPAQYYRLLDPTNVTKSINKMNSLLKVLGCEIDVIFKDNKKNTKDILVSV